MDPACSNPLVENRCDPVAVASGNFIASQKH